MWQNAVLIELTELQEQNKMPRQGKGAKKLQKEPRAVAKPLRPKVHVGDVVQVFHDQTKYDAKLQEGSDRYWVHVTLKLPHSRVWRKTVLKWSRRDLFKKMATVQGVSKGSYSETTASARV